MANNGGGTPYAEAVLQVTFYLKKNKTRTNCP